jgi:hypothetical protein
MARAPGKGFVRDEQLKTGEFSMHWRLWPTLYWVAWLAFFCFWEAYAGFDKKHDVPMLTQATVRYVRWWITMPFLTWLWIHFAVRYANPRYIEWLKGSAHV